MKSRKNILDPFAERLMAWEKEKLTCLQMVEQLRLDGCETSESSVSRYLECLRQAELQRGMFALIASGGEMNRKLDKAFAKNPAPEISRLVEMIKTLILSLQINGAANPKLLQMAAILFGGVMEFAKLEAKKTDQALDERRVKLLEKKAAAYDRAQAALTAAKESKGGITPETLSQIERELKLL